MTKPSKFEEEVNYISFAHDSRFFMVIGKDLYYNVGEIGKPLYKLLRRNYENNKKNAETFSYVSKENK